MKKIGILLLLLTLLAVLVGCASDPATQQSGNTSKETETAEVAPDEVLMQQLIDAIGDDLMSRAKAADFQLDTSFSHYDYAPNESWEPSEGDYTDDLLFVTVEVYAPKTPGEAADSDLMRELQYAVIDSNIFELTEEEKTELKSIYYSAENREDRISVKDGSIELHFLEFDSKAVLTLRMIDNGIKNNAHREDWHSTYKWEEPFN